MTTQTHSLSRKSDTTAFSQLRSVLQGDVITPDNPAYDAARTVYYGGMNGRPALIARPKNTAGVARVVTFARDTGLELAVRSGGHSPAGHSTTEAGIVLDLSQMKRLEVDVAGRTAWAQTGLTAGEYTKAVGAHGLATGFGDTGSVGIGGITLAGGIGFLVRKYGLTIDSLLAAEIVTAHGKRVYADDDTHPDLWAIRGGGGNFGVATRFKFRLHEVDAILGGMLVLPATPDTIASFVAQAEAAAPLRSIAAPLADMVRPMRYPEIYPPETGDHPVGSSRTLFLESIDRSVAHTILEHLRTSTVRMAAVEVRILGGAMARVSVDATAFAHRRARMVVNIAARYERAEEAIVHQPWVTDLATALRPGGGGAYAGFLADDGQARIREAYPGTTWQRLAAVKKRYDPTNLFRLNHNIIRGGEGL